VTNISTSTVCLTINSTALTCASLEEIDQAVNQRLAWIEDLAEDYGELVEAFFDADDDDSKAWRILIGIGHPHSVVHFSTLD